MSDNTCDIATLAKILDASDDELKGLVSDGILTEKSKGRFVPFQAVAEYMRHLRNMPGAGQIIDGELCVSSKLLREIFQVEESTVVRWGQKGCPKKGRGLWSLPRVLAWRGLVNIDGIESSGDIDLKTVYEQKQYYEAELKKAQAFTTNFDYETKLKQYVKITEVQVEIERTITNCRAKLLSLPVKAASELVGVTKQSELQEAIRKMIYEALDELTIPDFGDDGKTKNKDDHISSVQDMAKPSKSERI